MVGGTGHDVKLRQHELHKICNISHVTYQRQLKQITAGTCLQLGSITLLTTLQTSCLHRSHLPGGLTCSAHEGHVPGSTSMLLLEQH